MGGCSRALALSQHSREGALLPPHCFTAETGAVAQLRAAQLSTALGTGGREQSPLLHGVHPQLSVWVWGVGQAGGSVFFTFPLLLTSETKPHWASQW